MTFTHLSHDRDRALRERIIATASDEVVKFVREFATWEALKPRAVIAKPKR